MGLLARFRKPGGMEKLVALIESSNPKVRENILMQITDEDSLYAEEVKAQLIEWNDLLSFDGGALEIILSKVPSKVLATATCFMDEASEGLLVSKLNHKARVMYKDEKEKLSVETTKAMVAVARRKVIEATRKLDSEGFIKIKDVRGPVSKAG